LIYDHLSKKDWVSTDGKSVLTVLKGPPTAEKITLTSQHRYNTSVDLVAATDNLPIAITEVILAALLAKSRSLPGSIKLLAHESLYPSVKMSDAVGDWTDVQHGQCMGGYLSFPLLCIHSYLAALWATRGCERRILVNGDDTLISSALPVPVDGYPEGYRLNFEKTRFNDESFAELNSTVFLRNARGWHEVRHLRRGAFLNSFSGFRHAFVACRGNLAYETAFLRSRLFRRWGFTPSQIGFQWGNVGTAFMLERKAWERGHIALPLSDPQGQIDPDLEVVNRPLQFHERLATARHVFGRGKGMGEREEDKELTIGEFRREFTRRTHLLRPRKAGTFPTFCSPHLRERKVVEEAWKRAYLPVYYLADQDGVCAVEEDGDDLVLPLSHGEWAAQWQGRTRLYAGGVRARCPFVPESRFFWMW
jgi:hypothetical protein